MKQVVGACDVLNLNAAMDNLPREYVQELTDSGYKCIHRTDGIRNVSMDTRDAQSLALVFYTAMHNIQNYDRLVFPHMSARAQKALLTLGHNIRGLSVEMYGRPILLMNLRHKIADANGEVYRRPTGRMH
jgi:hypothetical protein